MIVPEAKSLDILTPESASPGTLPEPTDPTREFAFYGGVAKGYSCTDAEVLMAGPAGTGKTLAWLALCYRTCVDYPGARVLIVRKTRSSLTDSVLVTFERDILGHDHPLFTRSRVARLNRSSYHFANGSEIVLGGMDKPDKVLSSEYDLIYVPEATDLELTDWETLGGRIGRTTSRVPFPQQIADCNPTSPTHWLYQRCQQGLTKLVPTTHRDNPTFWDRVRVDWTDLGKSYLARLGRMTGPRRDRFLNGLWVQAEGLCFEGWDFGYHVVDPLEIDSTYRIYLSIDFGIKNPFVCQFWAMDPEDRLHLFKEIYHTGRIVEDHAKEIKKHLEGLPTPVYVVCDHDAEGRATLERHTDLSTVPADKKDNAGIEEICEWLKPGPDGRPRLTVAQNALCHEPDPELLGAGKPCRSADEFPGYVWDTAVKKGERPRAVNNHGADAARYLARYLAINGYGGNPRPRKPGTSILGRTPAQQRQASY